MSQFNPKKLNIEAIHAGQKYPDTRSAFLPSDVNEIIESLYGISLGVENSAKRAFIMSTPGNLIDISSVNKNIYFPEGTTIYADGYIDNFVVYKYVAFDKRVQLLKRGIVVYNKKTKTISIETDGFNSGSTYEVLYLFSFAYDSENNLVTDLPVEHLVNGEKQSSDRTIVKEPYSTSFAYINIDTKSYEISIPEGTGFGDIAFNWDETYSYAENVYNEPGLYEIVIVYDRTEELIKSMSIYELYEHRNYAWLFTIRMDGDKFVYCDLEAPFYVDGKLNDEQISEEITQELDRQKIALANLEYFVPNENVLTDNSAKYRKPIPENACPYAEVKKVCGLTQRSKNLIPFPYLQESKTEKGVTFTVNSNGTIIANGTATEEGVFTFLANWSSKYVPIKLNGTYTFSGVTDGISSGASSTYYLQLYVDGNSTAIVNKKPVTFTTNGNITQLSLFFKVGAKFSNTSIMPMLNEGSVALPYAQYFDGFRDSAVTEIRSEHGNLFNFENVYPTLKGENGKIIKRSGAHNIDLFANTTGGNTVFPIEYLDKLIYLKAGTYYLYYNFEEEGLTDYTMTVLGVEQSGKTFGVDGSQLTSGKTFKPTKDCYITLRVGEREQVTITNLMITTKPQTDYIPYNPDIITIPEQIQSLEGYGIGKSESENNYIDFEKKVFHKGYGKIRLLSTMGGYNAENNWYYLSVGELGVAPIARGVLCNALPSVDIPANAEADGAYFNPSMSHLLLRKSEFTTQAEYKQWLADNEVYIVEKLATPVVTDVSQYLTEDNIINVEDGVFIKAVNANELDAPTTVTYVLKLEVENKYVPIQQTTSTTALVKQDTGGTVSLVNYTDNANGYTIPYRNGSGTTRFADPTEEKNPVTLGYANEHYVPKLQIAEGEGTFAYVSDSNNPTGKIQIQYGAPIAYTLPARDAGGIVVVGTPFGDKHAVNLGYAKENFAPLKPEYKLITWSTDVQGKTYTLDKDVKYLLVVDVYDVSDGELVYDEYADGVKSVVNWGADFFTYECYKNNYEEDGYYEGIVLKPKFKSEQVVFSIEHPPCYVGMDYVVVKQR